MENKENKKGIKKEHIFQGAMVFSGLILAFGIFNITEITQRNSNIEMLEMRIEREKRAIQQANIEIEEIEAEFLNAEESFPLDIDGRVHLIVRDIKRLIASHQLVSTITPSSTGQARGSNSPLASIDNETGLRTISFNVELEYNRYNDVKLMLVELRDSFPITINSLVFSDRNASFNFTIYGN